MPSDNEYRKSPKLFDKKLAQKKEAVSVVLEEESENLLAEDVSIFKVMIEEAISLDKVSEITSRISLREVQLKAFTFLEKSNGDLSAESYAAFETEIEVINPFEDEIEPESGDPFDAIVIKIKEEALSQEDHDPVLISFEGEYITQATFMELGRLNEMDKKEFAGYYGPDNDNSAVEDLLRKMDSIDLTKTVQTEAAEELGLKYMLNICSKIEALWEDVFSIATKPNPSVQAAAIGDKVIDAMHGKELILVAIDSFSGEEIGGHGLDMTMIVTKFNKSLGDVGKGKFIETFYDDIKSNIAGDEYINEANVSAFLYGGIDIPGNLEGIIKNLKFDMLNYSFEMSEE